MFDQWQQPLDIRGLVRQGVTLKGELNTAELPRLAGVVLNHASVRFSLDFGKDGDGQATIRGDLETTVEMTCQRCLGPVAIDLNPSISLGVVGSESEARLLPDELDPLVLGDEQVRLADLVEDEILLALPVAPRHAHPCVAAHREHEGADEKTDNPFAALRGLVEPSKH
ncbi:MAG: YceD family protein [Pseudomonadota bacterium]